MLEVLGLTTAQEVLALTGVGIVDFVLPELILAEAMVITGVLIYRAIRKHKQKKDNEENKPADTDQDVPQPDDEEQKNEEQRDEEQKDEEQIDEQIDDEIAIEEAKNVEELLDERDERLDDMRGNDPGNDGGGNDPGNDGGGNDPGNDGGGNDPNPDGNNEANNNNRRRENPYIDLIIETAKYLAEQYDKQKKKEQDQQKQHEDGKISDEQYDEMQTENQQIRNQLEAQKQMLDILDAMGINEITDEQALVQLEKIEEDLKNIQKKEVKVGDVFAQDVVTF